MWIIGGIKERGNMNDVWNSSGGPWTRVITKAIFSPRIEHISILFKNTLYVIGGM